MKIKILKERRRVGATRPLSRFIALLLTVAFLSTYTAGMASSDEALGTYECADITLEATTDKTIDDVPVYLLTLEKGYEALLFAQCSKYDRIKVSGDSTITANIATNTEITRGSELYEHAMSDYTVGLLEERTGFDYLLFSAEKNEFSFVTFTETITTVAYIVVEWEKEDDIAVSLGTYESADITLETTTDKTIDDVPVYLLTLEKGYEALLFAQCSKYDRIKVSGDSTITANIATNTEITRGSELYEHAMSDYTVGLLEERTGFDYLLFSAEKNEFSFVTFTETITTVAYIVVEWERSTGTGVVIDKTALEATIALVTGDNARKWYQSGDRYNGKPGDTITNKNSGFWNELNAEDGPLVNAQAVYTKVNATRAEVNAATAELKAAIARLIPVTQINATALYEAATASYGWYNHEAIINGAPSVTRSNTTAASWEAYQSALEAANGELAKLFYQEGEDIPEGKQVGDATPYNSSSEGDAAQNAADALSNLETAVEGLDQLAVSMALSGISPELETAKLAYDGLDKLANKLYHPDTLDRSRYTPESWAVFETARAEALSFLNTHSRPDDRAGYRECLAYTEAYRAFWSACYEGLTSASAQVRVELSITDNYDLLGGKPISSYAGTWSLSLPAADATVAGALAEALGAGYSFNNTDNHFQLGVYLNGVYVFNMISTSADTSIASRSYENVRLQDGDTLVVAMMYAPTESFGSTGQARAAAAKDLLSAVQYQFTRSTADGTDIQLAEGTAGQPVSLNVRFVLAHPMEYNGRLSAKNGARVYISEAFATEAEARRAGASKNSGVVTDSEGGFSLTLYSAPGSSEGWYVVTIVGDGENGGLSNGPNLLLHVTDGDDLSALKEAAKASLEELQAEYEDEFYTEAQLEEIRSLYETAAAAIDGAANSGDINAALESAGNTIRAIQQLNANNQERSLNSLTEILAMLPTMDDLQDGLLYQQDSLLLDLLFGSDGLYSARMTPYQKKQLTVAENALLSALEEIYGELQAGTRTLEARPSFHVKLRVVDSADGEEVSCGVFQSPYYKLFTNIRLTEDNRFLFDAVSSVRLGDRVTEFDLPSDGLYWFVPSCYITDQMAYQLDYIDLGVNDHYKTGNGYQMYMLRSDTEITMYVVPVGTADPSGAYLNELKSAFDAYKRSDYTTEQWTELLNAYDEGREDILSASGSEAKQAALEEALAAMAAVDKKPVGGGEDIVSADGLFNAGKQVGTVTLTAENTTYPGGAFTGVLISEPNYPIGENDTMMTVILRALADAGYSWSGTGGSGYNIGYLASVSKDGESLGEFSGESGSGWMGSLNDFLVNEGFPGFTVANNGLSDGDVIRLMYTQNLGDDLGGRWGDNNTTLSSLVPSTGSIVPKFASGTPGTEYSFALLIDGADASVKLTPTAANKNYLVKTFLNEKVIYNNEGNSFYKRTEYIPVQPGDVIWVGVGEKLWPSMNKQGAEASNYSPTWYALHVITAENGADYVNELIAALPAAKNVSTSNYQAVQEQIDAIDAVIAVLSSSEKARVNTDALEAVREAAANFGAVADLKAEIKALPKNITEADREAVEAAKAAYDALTAAQRNLLTVAETNKLQKAVNTLTLMDKLKTVPETKDFDSAAAGSQDALIAALKDWLGPDGLNVAESSRIMVEVSSFTEATAGGDGSYSATVSFILGDGSAAATQTKDIRGVITRSGEAGVTGIKVSGVPATGSGAAWAATLPYGTDLKTLTGEAFEITLKDEKAQVTEGPSASNNGETWSFTVTALDGTTAAYTVTLSVSEVAVKVLDSWIYSLSDDAEPVKLDPAAVTGLLEAVSVDALELPAGTEEAFLWLEVREKAGDNVYEIMPVFAADEEESRAVPAAALIGKIGLTLPVPGTEYAKVLFGTEYLDAQGDANGIRFDVAEAGDYTLIPDARIATVTFHLCGGSSGEVTDGETVVYYREDLNKALPIAVKDGSGFAGWNAKEDGSGQTYSAVSAALPADLYAVWQTELPEELKITELTNAAAVTSSVEEDGTAVITVKADVPCVVIMKTGDSYELLEGVENADGSYSFRQENYDESMEFFVAAKGDYDGDGVFRTVDLAKANMDLVANKTIDPLTILIMGVDSGKLRTVDLAMLNLSIINKDLDW